MNLPRTLWIYVLLLHTPLVFHPEEKRLDILKLLVPKFKKKYNKVAFIRVNEEGELARYSEFIRTYHNTNIIVQTTGGDEYKINGKIDIPKKTLDNITSDLLLNLSLKIILVLRL